MARNPSNQDSVVDSRDILARIKELRDERQVLSNELESARETLADFQDPTSAIATDEIAEQQREVAARKEALADFDASYDGRELTMLTALSDECSDYASDWIYGETLIRDSYFQEYAEELATDCGMIDPKLVNQWPYTCIDWERAARELQYDYTSVDFDGVEYWVRSC